MGHEWPFEGRIRPLRANVLVSLAAVAPLFRLPAICGGDALLIALKFIGAVVVAAAPLRHWQLICSLVLRLQDRNQ